MAKMYLVALASLSLLVAMASSGTSEKEHYDVNNAGPIFEDFIVKYDRQYKDEADKEVHFRAFVESLKKINEMNAKSPSAVFGINKFADYTEEEKKGLFGFKRP